MSLGLLAQQAVHEPAECPGLHWEEHSQQVRDVILPLHSTLLRHICSAGLPSSTDKDIPVLDDEGLGHLSGEKAEGAGTFQPQGELIRAQRHLKGGSFHNRCLSVIPSYYFNYL